MQEFKPIGYAEHISDRYQWDRVGLMAYEMVLQHGMWAGKANPDDTSGRPTIVELSPYEVVTRAFAIAKLFYDRIDDEGRIKDLGELKDRRFVQQSYDNVRIVPVKDKSIEEEHEVKTTKENK